MKSTSNESTSPKPANRSEEAKQKAKQSEEAKQFKELRPLLYDVHNGNVKGIFAIDVITDDTMSDTPSCSDYGTLTEELSSVVSYEFFPTMLNSFAEAIYYFYRKHRRGIKYAIYALFLLIFVGIAITIGYIITAHVDHGCRDDPTLSALICCDDVNQLVQRSQCGKTEYIFQASPKCETFSQDYKMAAGYMSFCYVFAGRQNLKWANWHYVVQSRHVAYDMRKLIKLNNIDVAQFVWYDLFEAQNNMLMYSNIDDEVGENLNKKNTTMSLSPEKCFAWYKTKRNATSYVTNNFCGFRENPP